MRKDSDYPIDVSSGSPVLEPKVIERFKPPKAGLVRELGARADRVVVIGYDDGRIIRYDSAAVVDDDIHLAHSARARRLGDY